MRPVLPGKPLKSVISRWLVHSRQGCVEYPHRQADPDAPEVTHIAADASSSWTSESTHQLTFDEIATTRALCPPPSLGDKFLAQLKWVRTYLMKDGHMFLATMADGAIIEFEPLPPVVAQVLGDDIHASQVGELQTAIFSRLFESYAAEHDIEVTDADMNAFIERMKQGSAGEDELTAEEAAQVDVMRQQMGYAMIRQWKINKSLYAAYGGRVIYQQFGPEPLDAYQKFLREKAAAGDFTITDPDMDKAFWSYFTDESKHDFMAPDSEDLKQAFTVPPWK